MGEFPTQFKDKLCWELGCKGYNASIQRPKENILVIILLTGNQIFVFYRSGEMS